MEASDPYLDTVSDSAAAAECSPFASPLLNVLKARKIAVLSQIGGGVLIGKITGK